MDGFIEKYKYYIGGSTIFIILFYLIYNNFFNNINNKEIKEIKEIRNEIIKSDKPEISQEEFLLFIEPLKKEFQKLTQSIMELNINHNKTQNDHKKLEKQFKKDIIKKNIIIDTIHIPQTEVNHSSNYIINFGDNNLPEVYKNVIGFRLINAVIPYTFYTVHTNNNIIKIKMAGETEYRTIRLIPGQYTFTELGEHLQGKIVAEGGPVYINFIVTPNVDAVKYTISSGDGGGNFDIDWANSTSNRLFGFKKKVNSTGEPQYESDHEADQSVHYIDLTIKEIPSIACKINSKGKEIISRIPFNKSAGNIIYYRTPEHELQTSNYFYPMKLPQLTIQLIDDHGFIYDANHGDNSFEFELTILQNTALLK
tara:strand:- start:1661 stop:2761 length:1101 start_codon:yes stop_codon:yes gene_type:complete